MYKTDNAKIGIHLANLIKNSSHKNDRQFAIAYLKLRDSKSDFHEINPDDIQKMQNRICQMKKGNKGIQIEDLPIFSDLLEVSIDDILSAGTVVTPSQSRKTNYSIAFSKDPDEWRAYVERDDKLILNSDEYNKTVIDYALDAGNYDFLKYLMDNGYIWFVGDNEDDYAIGFGAGTSIKRRQFEFYDTLDFTLKEQDDLRFKMIALAIRAKDFQVLDSLHARELPLLHNVNPFVYTRLKECRLPKSRNVDLMIESIASSENTVLSYFFQEFDIETKRGEKNTFVFPYAGKVLDALMIQKKNAVQIRFLEKAISHNKHIQKALRSLIDHSTTDIMTLYGDSYYPDDNKTAAIKREALRDYEFYPETGFILYRMPFYCKNVQDLVSNVINVTATAQDPEVQFLIKELHNTYNYFITLKNAKEN